MTTQPRPPLPVILLHATGRTPQMWQSQVEAIGASRQVVAPWLAGLRPGKQSELSLAATAAEVIATMDRYGIEQAILVGHLLGALTALQVAADEPDMVAGMVLSGAMVAPSAMALRLQKATIRLMPKSALAESGATKDALIRSLDVIATADFGRRLARIVAPTLVLAGTSDPARAAGEELATELPNGSYAELAGAGTSPSLEAPDAYNEQLVRFLSGLPE